MSTHPRNNTRLSLAQIALFGVLGAMTFGAKMVMALLPNVEPVSLLVMVYAVVFGRKCIYPIYVYVSLELLYWGIGTWNIMYLYVWAILALGAWLMRKTEQPLAWALLSGLYGLLFGLFCTPVDMCIGGIGYAMTKWASGILFDVYHCAGNFVMALVLFVPLRRLTARLYSRIEKR